MIGPTRRKNRLTFGGDPVPDTDSGLLLQFHLHHKIEHFRKLISICHTIIRPLFTKLGEITDADKGMTSLHLGSDPADRRIRINPDIESWIPFGRGYTCWHEKLLLLAVICSDRMILRRLKFDYARKKLIDISSYQVSVCSVFAVIKHALRLVSCKSRKKANVGPQYAGTNAFPAAIAL